MTAGRLRSTARRIRRLADARGEAPGAPDDPAAMFRDEGRNDPPTRLTPAIWIGVALCLAAWAVVAVWWLQRASG